MGRFHTKVQKRREKKLSFFFYKYRIFETLLNFNTILKNIPLRKYLITFNLYNITSLNFELIESIMESVNFIIEMNSAKHNFKPLIRFHFKFKIALCRGDLF